MLRGATRSTLVRELAQQLAQLRGLGPELLGFQCFASSLEYFGLFGLEQWPNLKVYDTYNPRFLWKLEFDLGVRKLCTDWHDEAVPYDP